MPNGMQYDERGRPYFLTQDGQRSYVSPVAMGEQKPADNTGIFHQAPQWDQKGGEWQTPFDWGNALSLGVAGGLGAGALGAAGLFGGGGAGAASGGSAASAAGGSPMLSGMLPGASANGLIGGSGATGLGGTLASHSLLPANSMINASVPGSQMADTMGGGGFDWKKLLPGMGGNDQQGGGMDLASLLPLLIHFLSGGGGPSDQQTQIQDLTMNRMNAQNPLFEAASRLAFDRLPTTATQGLQRPTLDPSQGR